MTSGKGLSLEIAAKYVAIATPTTIEQPVKNEQGEKVGSVICDLRTGTVAQADALVFHGYRGIELKKSKDKKGEKSV